MPSRSDSPGFVLAALSLRRGFSSLYTALGLLSKESIVFMPGIVLAGNSETGRPADLRPGPARDRDLFRDARTQPRTVGNGLFFGAGRQSVPQPHDLHGLGDPVIHADARSVSLPDASAWRYGLPCSSCSPSRSRPEAGALGLGRGSHCALFQSCRSPTAPIPYLTSRSPDFRSPSQLACHVAT
jgi:hypothetical protein